MKTCEELGIIEDELKALVAVRDKLRGGVFKHVREEDIEVLDHGAKGVRKKNFCMGVAYEPLYNCGKVGCIGGWMAIELGIGPSEAAAYVSDAGLLNADGGISWEGPMHNLFYPDLDYLSYDDITPEDAANAIDNFLETGEPGWKEIEETHPMLEEAKARQDWTDEEYS